jgi:hypothetical protein
VFKIWGMRLNWVIAFIGLSGIGGIWYMINFSKLGMDTTVNPYQLFLEGYVASTVLIGLIGLFTLHIMKKSKK